VLEYTDFPDPEAGPDDVLIRVRACGICGSDVLGYTGKTGRRIPPIIMGHEAAGIVEQTGANFADTFKKGDRVCFDSTVYCNACGPCKSSLFNRCEKRQVLGVSTGQFKRHGAFAEYVCVPGWIVSKLPGNVSFTQAALLEPASVGRHAVNRAPVSNNDTVVIIGAGTIGLFVLQACRQKQAGTIVVDIDDFRLDLARELGADVTINSATRDLKQAVMELTGGTGADVTFEVVGLAETLRTCISLTKPGGFIVAVGNLEDRAEINPQEIVAGELTITGTYASAGEFRDCIGSLESGQLTVDPLISEVLPLEQGARAFERLLKADGDLIKIILEP
jgi:L-iditol 2-dehydrogenase